MGTDAAAPAIQVASIRATRAAGLHYASDDRPGITRQRKGKGFAYFNPGGRLIRDEATIRRIAALVIPPAYRDVWICPDALGHLQATGRDDRGRKQYRYHKQYAAVRNADKFSRMVIFAELLPVLRQKVDEDAHQPGLCREKVLAVVVMLLERTMIRIGNDEYVRDNHSYGLTTMRDKHVHVHGNDIDFCFRGKSGLKHQMTVHDRKLARIVKRCRDLPGQELFQWMAGDGSICDVGSGDVNDYLHEISGHEITAKDFRTWGGTVEAAVKLYDEGSATTQRD